MDRRASQSEAQRFNGLEWVIRDIHSLTNQKLLFQVIPPATATPTLGPATATVTATIVLSTATPTLLPTRTSFPSYTTAAEPGTSQGESSIILFVLIRLSVGALFPTGSFLIKGSALNMLL